jgi:hypothetical protein
MDSNVEILEYHLERTTLIGDQFVDRFKQRLIGIVNAVDERQPKKVHIAL